MKLKDVSKQKVAAKFFWLGLVAIVWSGCTTKGVGKPWEVLSSVGTPKKGEEHPGEDATGVFELEQEVGDLELGLKENYGEGLGWMGPGQGDFEGSGIWPPLEELSKGWQRALRKARIPELEEVDHPIVEGYMREIRGIVSRRDTGLLTRSSKYLPRMREIFREEGVPEDLVYLAFVESGFNPWAQAGKNCVGMWQFTEATGRRYGLRIDSHVDERRDPEKSTRAAARYLRDLYQSFRSWDLVIAAYNAGEAFISQSMARADVEGYWDLHSRGGLARATREFVPRVMAAIRVAREEEEHLGLSQLEEDLWRFDKVHIPESLDLETLAGLLGCTKEELKRLNPQLKSSSVQPGEIRVPEGKGEELKGLLAQKGFMVRRSSPSRDSGREFLAHRVRPGDTLERIAKSYGTSPEEIRRINLLDGRKSLRVGTQLLVPVARVAKASSERQSGMKAPRPSTPHQKAHSYHVVQKGETLWTIARRYGVSAEEIRRWNNLQGTLLKPGDRLRLEP